MSDTGKLSLVRASGPDHLTAVGRTEIAMKSDHEAIEEISRPWLDKF